MGNYSNTSGSVEGANDSEGWLNIDLSDYERHWIILLDGTLLELKSNAKSEWRVEPDEKEQYWEETSESHETRTATSENREARSSGNNQGDSGFTGQV